MNAQQRKQQKKAAKRHVNKFMDLMLELADAIKAGKEDPKEVAANLRELVREAKEDSRYD